MNYCNWKTTAERTSNTPFQLTLSLLISVYRQSTIYTICVFAQLGYGREAMRRFNSNCCFPYPQSALRHSEISIQRHFLFFELWFRNGTMNLGWSKENEKSTEYPCTCRYAYVKDPSNFPFPFKRDMSKSLLYWGATPNQRMVALIMSAKEIFFTLYSM